MVRIHGISSDKYQNFVTKTKVERKCFLRNTPVYWKRFIYALKNRERVNNRKLAEWAVLRLEDQKKLLSDKKFIIVQNLCLTILPKVKKNEELQKRFQDAIKRYQNNSSSSDSSSSEEDSSSTSSMTQDDSKNSAKQSHAKGKNNSKSSQQVKGSHHVSSGKSASSSARSTIKLSNSANKDSNIDLQDSGKASRSNDLSSSVRSSHHSSSNNDVPKDKDAGKIDLLDLRLSGSSSLSFSGSTLSPNTTLTAQGLPQLQPFNEADFEYDTSKAFVDNIHQLKKAIDVLNFSKITSSEINTLLIAVLEFRSLCNTTLRTSEIEQWNGLKRAVIENISLSDAQEFLKYNREYKDTFIEYHEAYKKFIQQKKQAAKQNVTDTAPIDPKAKVSSKDAILASVAKQDSTDEGSAVAESDSIADVVDEKIDQHSDERLSEELKSSSPSETDASENEVLEEKSLTDSDSVSLDGSYHQVFEEAMRNISSAIRDEVPTYPLIMQQFAFIQNLLDKNDVEKKDIASLAELITSTLDKLDDEDDRSESQHEEISNDKDELVVYLTELKRHSAFIIDEFVDNLTFSGDLADVAQQRSYFAQGLDFVKRAASKVGETAISMISYVADPRNVAEYDVPEVNLVKASKYECLLTVLNTSLAKLPTTSNKDDAAVLEKLYSVVTAGDIVNIGSQDLSYLTNIRDAFEDKALNAMRDAVRLCENSSKDISPQLKTRVYKAAYDLYTTNNMDQQNKALLGMLTKDAKSFEEEPVKDWDYDLMNKLTHTSNAIDKAPDALKTFFANRWARSAKDYISFNFSAIGAGNPPQLLEKITLTGDQRSHTMHILGFGSPTIQSRLTCMTHDAEIDPIFRGAQHYMNEIGKTHLYISLQDARTSENLRNQPIMNAQNELESFHAITLSKNTKFYEGGGEEAMPVADFKAELHNQVFEMDVRKSGCYISGKVKLKVLEKTGKSLDDTSKEIINALEAFFLGGQGEITKEERETFIEMYYNLLVAHIAMNLEVDFLNFTCKDGIDRGMGALAWFIFMFVAMNEQEDNPKTVETFQKILYTRAWWTRKRNIIGSRETRALEDASHLKDTIKVKGLDQYQNLVKHFMPKVNAVVIESLA